MVKPMAQPKPRALLSVTDKTGLAALADALGRHGYELIASGGTARALREAGYEVLDVSEVTGQPEILGGRVKTLHPAIAAGVLAPSHADLEGTGFAGIDVVVVNLYDFEGALAGEGDEAELVESVDIGGPTLLRAAAKNFERVTVLSDPSTYTEFVRELDAGGGTPRREFRRRMAAAVFGRTSTYDAAIAGGLFGEESPAARENALRYGENPHQTAHWSVTGGGLEEMGLTLHGGAALSYNNILDLVAVVKLMLDLPANGCAVVKHTNPCGVGVGTTAEAALERALAGDPVSAFGGIVGLRQGVEANSAAVLKKKFLEVLVAPSYTDEAAAILATKKKLRWLSVDLERFAAASRGNERRWGKLRLWQDEDAGFPELEAWRHAAGPAPSQETIDACHLAWRVAKHVKSNAIVIGDEHGTLGIGAGQMSRVDSGHLAVRKARDAGHELRGACAASDGFFPFADGLEALAAAGIKAVIQPGGSIRDEEVVAAADRLGVTLCLTGVRHFRH
jgi:phosphoribosylaminoimidazolecarboxamide formyltransferase/IMP cyclohydrolase